MKRLLIIGNKQPYHIGSHLYEAAQNLGVPCKIYDSRNASSQSRIIRGIFWRLPRRRPIYLDRFSQQVLNISTEYRPDYILVTGITPPNAFTLYRLKEMGIICVNYLTDDPWNTNHSQPWFLKALQHYAIVFTPRQANIADLKQIVPQVEFLPFGYVPKIHFPEKPPPNQQEDYLCDVLFYGGADKDRIPYIDALINAGINIHLYGGFWQRYAKARPFLRGMADAQVLRWAVSSAKINLCLVRRANRDGHVMRTFEVPAMAGACMLTEDTLEHRAIFGDNGKAVVYFTTPDDLVAKTKQLLTEPEKRMVLAQNAHTLITGSQNTYQDRLAQMIAIIEDNQCHVIR